MENGTRRANQRVFFDRGTGRADGSRVDPDGDLWCCRGMGEELDGVLVVAPEAKRSATSVCRSAAPDLVFGTPNRNRLLMRARQSIYSLYVNTRGAV